MRAVCIRDGADANRIMKAVADEVGFYLRENGNLEDAVIRIQVCACADEQKENGTAPQRKVRSR